MALDPSYFFYADGTITLTNGSDIATGQFVAWDPAVLPFDFVFPNDGLGGMSVVKEVLAVNQIRLAKPWTGPTLTNVPYFMVRWANHIDPRLYALRLSDYLARLKAIPANFEEVGTQVAADAAAVAAAMIVLQTIEANVDGDRQAAETAAAAAQQKANDAAASADEAEQWAQAASTSVLPNNGVTNAKLADMVTGRIKGRVSIGTGDPEDLTPQQARSVMGLPWKTIDIIAPTTDINSAIITIPSDVTMLRFYGAVTPVENNKPFGARVSFNGTTYNSAAGNYQLSFDAQTASAGASIFVHGVGQSRDYIQISLDQANVVPLLINGLFSKGSSSVYPLLHAEWGGHIDQIGGVNGRFTTLPVTLAAAQKLMFYFSGHSGTNTIKAGSKLIVEGC